MPCTGLWQEDDVSLQPSQIYAPSGSPSSIEFFVRRRPTTMWGGRDPFDDPFFTGRPERSRDRGDRRDDDRRLERRDPFALMDQMMGGGMLGGFGGDMPNRPPAEDCYPGLP